MKQLKQHWSAQPLSLLLSILMALPVFAVLLLQAPKAQAQGLDASQPTWAVLDFANPSGYGSTDVGRLAADSFVVALAKLNRYAVLPRQDLLNGIQAETLTPPLNLTSIERLGQHLGVQAVVAGEISSISFSRDRRQAKVGLVIRVIDPRSGFLLNGALAEGFSNTRPIPVSDEEQLVNEAFGNAAFNAVKKIGEFNLPVATVLLSGYSGLNGNSETVTLDKGIRDGLYPGLDMIVTRNGLITGRIKVSEATNNDANAVITDLGTGIKPEDRATAIFHLPSYTIDKGSHSFNTATAGDVSTDPTSSGTRHSAFSGIGGILVALLAAFLLVSAVRAGHHGTDNSLGGAGLNGVNAVAGRASDLGGPLTSVPVGISFPAGSFVPVAVRITANIGNIAPQNFLEFHVYRSDAPAVLSSPGALGFVPTVTSGTNSGNSGNNNGGNNGGNNGTGGTLGINGFGQIPILAQAGNSPLVVFDDPSNKPAVVASKPDPVDTSTLNTLSVTQPNTTVGGVTANFGLPGTGLAFGQRVSYAIEGLYVQPSTFSSGTINPGTNSSGTSNNTNTNGNTNNNTSGNNTTNTSNTSSNTSGSTGGHGVTYQLTGRRNTNSVTLIEPVMPTATAVTGTGSTNVNVTVPATRGADDYILQISTDAGFSNAQTYHAQAGALAFSATPTNPTQGTPVNFQNINLTTAFPNGGPFFYRIGARDSGDGGAPYVYSDPLPLTQVTGAIRFHGRARN